jgi:hypothetical protein
MEPKRVSWSQFSKFQACPRDYKLSYIDKLAKRESNIFLVFGKAAHTVIQKYLITLYNKSVKEANELNLTEMLQDEMKREFLEAEEAQGFPPASKDQMIEFFYDGVKILQYLTAHQSEYFKKKDHSLLGIELDLNTTFENNVGFIGYLDIVLLNEKTQKIKIVDLKTSTNGWNKYQKADKNKTNQLLMYKHFYSKLYNIALKDIEVEFLIVKRKLYDNVDYYQKRFQKVVPASGNVSINKVLRDFEVFLDSVFNEDGQYNTEREYLPIAGKNNKNCKWCEFSDMHEHCDPKERIKE